VAEIDLSALMQQAQALQARMKEMQESASSKTVEAQSGGGMVRVVVDGTMRVRKIEIDPAIVAANDKSMLEDLILVAINDGMERAQKMLADEMGRHQDDRDMSGLLVLLQPLTERPPIFSAQQDVEQDQVRGVIAHVLETRAVQAGLDAVFCALQDLLDQLHYRWLIIYHEDTLVHLGLFFSAPNTSMTHLRSSGREKENVDPCPSTLSTQILPP